MSLTDLANLGEFLSSVAVLASLIYLSVQVRDAKRNQRALILEGRAARESALSAALAQPELAAVFAKLNTETSDLTPTEFWQFRYMVRAAVANYENLYFQHKQGLMGDAGFESVSNTIRMSFRVPAVQALWQVMLRTEFSGGFAGYVDGIIAEHVARAEPQANVYAHWQTVLAEKIAAA